MSRKVAAAHFVISGLSDIFREDGEVGGLFVIFGNPGQVSRSSKVSGMSLQRLLVVQRVGLIEIYSLGLLILFRLQKRSN
jgi:hypothetical protein